MDFLKLRVYSTAKYSSLFLNKSDFFKPTVGRSHRSAAVDELPPFGHRPREEKRLSKSTNSIETDRRIRPPPMRRQLPPLRRVWRQCRSLRAALQFFSPSQSLLFALLFSELYRAQLQHYSTTLLCSYAMQSCTPLEIFIVQHCKKQLHSSMQQYRIDMQYYIAWLCLAQTIFEISTMILLQTDIKAC